MYHRLTHFSTDLHFLCITHTLTHLSTYLPISAYNRLTHVSTYFLIAAYNRLTQVSTNSRLPHMADSCLNTEATHLAPAADAPALTVLLQLACEPGHQVMHHDSHIADLTGHPHVEREWFSPFVCFVSECNSYHQRKVNGLSILLCPLFC